MVQHCDASSSVPSTPVKDNNFNGNRSIASYPLTPQSFRSSSKSLRRSDKRVSCEGESDYPNGCNVVAEDQSIASTSSSFLQFSPSIVSAVIFCDEDESKEFQTRLLEVLNRFGLLSVDVEMRKSLVTKVKSCNVRCSDPFPVRSGSQLMRSASKEQSQSAVKHAHRRRKKSGTVLCLMPLPEDGLCGDHDLLTVRSAPTILEVTPSTPIRRGSDVQHFTNSNIFNLTPSVNERLPTSSATITSNGSQSASSERSRTSSNASAALSRSLPPLQKLSDEQVSPITQVSRRRGNSPRGLGRHDGSDFAERTMWRPMSEKSSDGLQQGIAASPLPGKTELKRFFTAIFKNQNQSALLPEMLFAEAQLRSKQVTDNDDTIDNDSRYSYPGLEGSSSSISFSQVESVYRDNFDRFD